MSIRITHTGIAARERSTPLVHVVIINSRGVPDNPRGMQWLEIAKQSVVDSSYPNLGLLVVDNTDRGISIGHAWNSAVDAASAAEYVFPLGDDDFLALDTIRSHVDYIEHHRNSEAGTDLIHVTSRCMAVDVNGTPIACLPIDHTGMFRRNWLKKNRFNASLQKFVDTDMHNRLKSLQQVRGKRLTVTMGHHFGYAYRQHPTMVSGMKVQMQLQPPMDRFRGGR